jgi:hypothetical protein
MTAASIPALLDKARRAVEASDDRLRQAAEYIASAKAQGASQARIAKAVRRSTAWVSRLLRWRRDGYRDTPFGSQSRQVRQARALRRLNDDRDDRRSVPNDLDRAPSQGEADALTRLRTARAHAMTAMFGLTISNGLRAQLVEALDALPANHPAQRVRQRLGLAWEELIVPAEDVELDDELHNELDVTDHKRAA